MLKKIAVGMSTLFLVTSLAACSTDEKVDDLAEVDLNGLTIADACEKAREAGWRVSEVHGTENPSELSDCSDAERLVARYWFSQSSKAVTLYFVNEKVESDGPEPETGAPGQNAVPDESVVPDGGAAEEPEAAPVKQESAVTSSSGYQAIYDEYAARLRNECPSLSIAQCAELSNEGVSMMAEYMWTADGIDGQYETYQTWAGKLTEVYMAEAR